jgi:hypothetical protein
MSFTIATASCYGLAGCDPVTKLDSLNSRRSAENEWQSANLLAAQS